MRIFDVTVHCEGNPDYTARAQTTDEWRARTLAAMNYPHKPIGKDVTFTVVEIRSPTDTAMTPERFRQIRQSLGLTQAAWGQWLGVQREAVNYLENGKRPLTDTVARLADAIDKGYRPVISEEEPPTP